MTNTAASRMTWADRAGVWLSGLCVVHCVATPLLISFTPVFAHLIPGEENIHRSLAVVLAAIGAIALLRGYRQHRRGSVPALLTLGLCVIGTTAWFGDSLPAHWMEVCLTVAGSGALITAHRLNHTFCRDCACASHCSSNDA